MRSLEDSRVVAVVGLRHQEFRRLQQQVRSRGWPVRLVYGGHISHGSNARRKAERAASVAELVLWNPEGARTFDGGFLPHLRYERIRGVSSAIEVVAGWLGDPPADSLSE
jgi:hypothetical protein